MTTETSKPRGRPRRFDVENAVAIAQQLFHAKGYDAVGVSDITTALGINPPSFYAAFGSKAGLYSRILDRYAVSGALPLQKILRADRSVGEALSDLLVRAAHAYAGAEASGCMVLEGTRSNDVDAREAACVFHVAAQDTIRKFIAERHPEKADKLTDFICTTMAGLSASARHGQSLERLESTARLAGLALMQSLLA
jgi:TetR/AcrR family transcriptional repressor for divergent bdcA